MERFIRWGDSVCRIVIDRPCKSTFFSQPTLIQFQIMSLPELGFDKDCNSNSGRAIHDRYNGCNRCTEPGVGDWDGA